VQERRWALLTLETCDGEEQYNFCCSSKKATAVATAPSSVAATSRRRTRKRPPSEKRREKERKRREVWKETRSAALHLSAGPEAPTLAAATLAAAASAAAAPAAAAPTAATPTAAAPTAATPAAAAPAAVAPTAAAPTAAAPAAAAPAAATPAAATPAAALPALAATAALRERNKAAAGERRSIARTSALAKRREGSSLQTPENLRFPELECFELEISLDLEEREAVFSPLPEEDELTRLEVAPWLEDEKKKMMPETELRKRLESAMKPVTPAPLVLTEEEKRERKADLERIADQFVATLNAACSKKKKKR
jgi:hypothetical protein